MPARPKKNRKHEKKLAGSYRIIAGEYRSRRLGFPEVDGLRPTTDRVRETLFNWIGSSIQGARVLDLFAGSGSLGFEAVSRGAEQVVCVELNSLAARELQANATTLGAQIEVVQGSALQYLYDSDLQFDLVFVDPPFRTGLLSEALSALSLGARLQPEALVYVEHEAELQSVAVPADWQEIKSKVAGQVRYRLFSVS